MRTLIDRCLPLLISLPASFLATAIAPSLLQPAYAEGSKDLIDSAAGQGNRLFLEYRQTTRTANVLRRTTIKVYAKSGETIELASSAIGIVSGAINYRAPDGTSGSFTTTSCGVIADRAAEMARTYTPCSVSVSADQEGIWEVDFVSPRPGNTTLPGNISVSANWTQPNTVPWVAAWDVTVKSGGNPVSGRVFTNYLAMITGDNGRPVNPKLYVLTKDGYQYRIDLNGLDPNGFIFFANNLGFKTDGAVKDPIYRSLQLTGPASDLSGQLPTGYTFHNPGSADTSTDVTHKVFFNPPDPSMPSSAKTGTAATTWLLQAPVTPPAPTSFAFEGIEGTVGRAGTLPLGGNFKFTTTTTSAYTITLDLNRDNQFGTGNDRTFVGLARPGSNTVFWDGKDGDGLPVSAGSVPYNAQISLYAGEAHFPYLDAEQHSSGIIVERLNAPSGSSVSSPDPFLVHYDDRNTGNSAVDFSLCASGETGSECGGTPPNPRAALTGISSQTGAHSFTNDFGNRRGMDTWVYYPSSFIPLNGGIQIQQADLEITKTDNLDSIAAGSPITYTITVTNNGPSNVVGATMTDTIPDAIENVTWACQITAGTGACGSNNGTGNTISTTLNLQNGATATFTVQGTVKVTATGTLSNTATILRPNDVTDPTDPNRNGSGNNTATDTTPLTGPAPRIRLVKRITAINGVAIESVIDPNTTPEPDDNAANWPTVTGGYLRGGINSLTVQPGDTLDFTIYFLSDGAQTATNINICDLIPTNTIFAPDTYGTGSGIQLSLGSSVPVALTNSTADSDAGSFWAANTIPSSPSCLTTNPNGGILVRLTPLPPATSPGNPTTSYGFVRFRTRVQ